MDAQRQLEIIGRFYDDMWNKFDKTVLPELVEPDVRFRGSLGQEKVGQAELGDYVDFIEAFSPDFRSTVVTTLTDGSRTFAQMSFTGTHKGEVFGIAPTGRAFEYAGAALFSFTDQLIGELWVLGDIYGLLRQLDGS